MSDRNDFASTQGRRYLDMIVQALVGNQAPSAHPTHVWARVLNRYIRKMGGDVSSMVDNLQVTFRWQAKKPSDVHRLKRFAQARQSLRIYIDELEIRTGNHVEQDFSKCGRKGGFGKGYTLRPTKSGRFNVIVTAWDLGRDRSIGLADTRRKAHKLGSDFVKEERARISKTPTV